MICMSWTISSKRETRKIYSEDKESWIEIRKMNQGDKDDLQDILATMDIAGKNEKQLANMNLGKMRAFQRKVSVIGWNLKDDEGREVPVSDEALRNLPDEVAELIDEAIEELNPEKISDKKKKI
jgi:hypothetical protein